MFRRSGRCQSGRAIFALNTVALWVLRAWNGDYSALSTIPVNLLTVLGFSTATAAAAKGITSGYVQTGKMTKPGAPAGAPAKNPPSPESGPAGTKVTLTGANLGSSPGSQLMLNGTQVGAAWLPTSIQLTVPDDDPATSADPAARAPWAGPFPRKMELVVSVQGQASNSVYFSVTGPRPAETGTPA